MDWGWISAAFFAGITVGIIGTVLYFRRWRKKVLAAVNTYKVKAERLEKAWSAKQTLEKPGGIEKG